MAISLGRLTLFSDKPISIIAAREHLQTLPQNSFQVGWRLSEHNGDRKKRSQIQWFLIVSTTQKCNFLIFLGINPQFPKKTNFILFVISHMAHMHIYILWIFPLFPQSQQSFTSFMIPASWHIFWTFNLAYVLNFYLTYFSKIRLNIGKKWRSVWHQIQNLLQKWISWRQRPKKRDAFEAFWKEF